MLNYSSFQSSPKQRCLEKLIRLERFRSGPKKCLWSPRISSTATGLCTPCRLGVIFSPSIHPTIYLYCVAHNLQLSFHPSLNMMLGVCWFFFPPQCLRYFKEYLWKRLTTLCTFLPPHSYNADQPKTGKWGLGYVTCHPPVKACNLNMPFWSPDFSLFTSQESWPHVTFKVCPLKPFPLSKLWR